jgi:hypothetical protein
VLGILKRALKPFPEVSRLIDEAGESTDIDAAGV